MQTLLQTLFSLLAVCRSSSDTVSEAETVAEYIARVKDGQAGTPLPPALEKEFGVRYKSDNDKMIREILVADSVIGCLEVGSVAARRWALHRLLEVCDRSSLLYGIALNAYRTGVLGLRRFTDGAHTPHHDDELAETDVLHQRVHLPALVITPRRAHGGGGRGYDLPPAPDAYPAGGRDDEGRRICSCGRRA